MQAIILAGGLGTRLRTINSTLPKALMPINSKPFIDYQIEFLYSQGIQELYFALGYKSDLLYKHLVNKYSGVFFSIEEEPLGTGGAIKLLIQDNYDRLDDNFFIINGDSLVDVNFHKMMRFHQKQNAVISMGLIKIKDVNRYGSVDMRNYDICSFNEKKTTGSGLINSGVYLFNKKIFNQFSNKTIFSLENDFFPEMLGKDFKGYIFKHNFFIDIGIPESYYHLINIIDSKGHWLDN